MAFYSAPAYHSAARPIQWGILGTGEIAHRFAADFVHVRDAKLVASGSRSAEKARAFAQRFGIPHWHDSYRALAEDPQVQAVYIATPASEHKSDIELCLRAGKAVLCEKPITVNAREAEEVIALARHNRIFLMEAMWTRFLPVIDCLRKLLAQGVVGEIRHVMADVASEVPLDAGNRLFSKELGGGALLQRGVYLLSLTAMILGTPTSVKSASLFAESGIDEDTGILLGYPNGRQATLWCSVRVRGQRRGVIMGTKGQIIIHDPIVCPSTLTLRRYGSRKQHRASAAAESETGLKERLLRYAKSSIFIRRLRERFPMLSDRVLHGICTSMICAPPRGDGLHYQVSEVNRCLRAGQLESDVMSLRESLNIMAAMDLIREQSQTGKAS